MDLVEIWVEQHGSSFNTGLTVQPNASLVILARVFHKEHCYTELCMFDVYRSCVLEGCRICNTQR